MGSRRVRDVRINAHIELARVRNNVRASLERANAAKDEFLGLISHELRTPITIILGNSHLLSRSGLLSEEETAVAIADMRKEAERMQRIVTNMLVLARLDDKGRRELEPCLLWPLVEAAVREFRRRSKREVTISPPVRAMVLANTGYIEQVIANLLSNAEKYSPPDSPIEIAGAVADGTVAVRVLDRGIGISSEDSSRIFDSFYRSPAARVDGSGLGLGLVVCKRLIEAQGGTIWARPRDHGGTESGFSLPLAEAPPASTLP